MTDNPGARGLWSRARTRLVGDSLQLEGPPALYDPFAPHVPLPDVLALPHDMRPWTKDGPLLVDALVQVPMGGTAAVLAFTSTWGLLTTHSETEPRGEFRRAAGDFYRLCESLLGGEAPGEHLAAPLARVHPLPVPHGVRWAFQTLLDAAYWQLACFLGEGKGIRECSTPGCGRLFVARGGKEHCLQSCGSLKRMRGTRARRREEEEKP